MTFLSRNLTTVLLATACVPSSAGLIGKSITHECPECGPPYSASFIAAVGGPDLTPSFDGYSEYAIDVEDHSIQVTWLADRYTRNPLHFKFFWQPADYELQSISLDPSSTINYGVAFTPNSLTFDFGGAVVATGDAMKVNLSPVPEPSNLQFFVTGLVVMVAMKRPRLPYGLNNPSNPARAQTPCRVWDYY